MEGKNDLLRDTSENSWFACSKHVLLQLESNTKCLHEIKNELTSIKIEIAKLKVKSGIWGMIGGVIPVAIGIAIWLFKK